MTFSLVCFPRSLIHIMPCQTNLQTTLPISSLFCKPCPCACFWEASFSSCLPSFFTPHFSPLSPISSRSCIQTCPSWIILSAQIPSFPILSSAHQGMMMPWSPLPCPFLYLTPPEAAPLNLPRIWACTLRIIELNRTQELLRPMALLSIWGHWDKRRGWSCL